MGEYREAFIGIDVAKLKNAIAIAGGERGGEIRHLTRCHFHRQRSALSIASPALQERLKIHEAHMRLPAMT